MSRTVQPQNNRPLHENIGQTAPGLPDDAAGPGEDRSFEADRKPRKGEKPLSQTQTGHPDAGGLAGQGGMTDAD